MAADRRNYKIGEFRWTKWREWEAQGTGYEDLMVESCANVLNHLSPPTRTTSRELTSGHEHQ